MTVLGTGVTDSNFYARKSAQAAEALQMFAASSERRKEEKRRRDMEDLNLFYRAIQDMPELANSPWAKDLATRSDNPLIPGIIDAMQNRYGVIESINAAGKTWQDTRGQMEDEYRRTAASLQSMPDMELFPSPSGHGAGFPIPNVQKMITTQALSQIDPTMIPLMAFDAMPPAERDKARIWAESEHGGRKAVPIPTPFDPGKHLEGNQAALYWGHYGKLPPENMQAAKITAGLEQSPADLQLQQFQWDKQEDTQTHQTDKAEELDRTATERIKLTDRLARARMERQGAIQRETAEFRQGLKGDRQEEVSATDLNTDNARAVLDWEAERKSKIAAIKATKRNGSPLSPAEMAAIDNDLGPRPSRIPQVYLSAIAAEANKKGTDRADRQATADRMMSAYLVGRQTGVPPAHAFQEALGNYDREDFRDVKGGGSSISPTSPSEPSTPPVDYESQIAERLVNEGKKRGATPAQTAAISAAALARYRKLVAAGTDPAQAFDEVFK